MLLATLAFVVSPYFTDGFSGFDPDLFPEPQRNPPVQPAGYAFGIWGLIYAWLIALAAFGLIRRRSDPAWDAPRLPLIISLGAGSAWIAVANTSAVWATVLIWAMLLTALAALWRVPQGDGSARWLGAAPVALYAGWLTAASCVSVGLMLAGFGVTGPVAAALLALALAVVIALTVQVRLGRAALYGVAVIWALVGVVVANSGGPMVVALCAGAGIIAVMAAIWRAARTPADGASLAGVRW
ncbi:MAG: hypothetical protein JJU42_16600 [Rhodobacteraceae bacterium]|nr:hypothetical protein [Paracoccaceae bacterium]